MIKLLNRILEKVASWSITVKLVAVILLLFIFFCLSFIIWYGKNDLFRLPFNAGVWGTAGDWFFGVVAGITGFLIYKVNKKQTEIIDLEKLKLKHINAPDYDFNNLVKHSKKFGGKDLYMVNFTGNGNSSINSICKMRLTFKNNTNDRELVISRELIVKRFHGISRSLQFNFFEDFDILNHTFDFTFNLEFEDILGNPYFIIFNGKIDRGKILSINKSGPTEKKLKKVEKDGKTVLQWIK